MCLRTLTSHGQARQDHLYPRGGFLDPPRATSRQDVDQDRREARWNAYCHALPLVSGWRGLWLVWCGNNLLHGRIADGDLQPSLLQVRGDASLYQQAALWPQARPWHNAATLRRRGASG